MQPRTRRAFLSTISAATLGLAGCVGGSASEGGSSGSDGGGAGGDEATDERDGAATTADGGTATSAAGTTTSVQTTAQGTATASGLRLDTYEVRGSPGETVAVQPPGEVVLLDFFATWCAPCKPQMKSLRSVRESFPDVHMLSITWEKNDSAIRDFWKEYEGTWPVASDPKNRTGPAYSVDRIPTLLVFNPEGNEVWRHVGLASEADIVENLEKAGAG